jgi:hypothetical protein
LSVCFVVFSVTPGNCQKSILDFPTTTLFSILSIS